MPRRECDQLIAPKEEKRLGGNEDRAGPSLDESFEGDVKVALGAGLYDEIRFPTVRTAACNSPISRSVLGLFGFVSRPITVAVGTTSMQQLQSF